MYGSSSPKMVDAMRNLCKHADIIVPNITEACLMLDEPYQPGPYTREYIQRFIGTIKPIGTEHGGHFRRLVQQIFIRCCRL